MCLCRMEPTHVSGLVRDVKRGLVLLGETASIAKMFVCIDCLRMVFALIDPFHCADLLSAISVNDA